MVPIVIEHPHVIGLLEIFHDHVIVVSIPLFHHLQRQLQYNVFIDSLKFQFLRELRRGQVFIGG